LKFTLKQQSWELRPFRASPNILQACNHNAACAPALTPDTFSYNKPAPGAGGGPSSKGNQGVRFGHFPCAIGINSSIDSARTDCRKLLCEQRTDVARHRARNNAMTNAPMSTVMQEFNVRTNLTSNGMFQMLLFRLGEATAPGTMNCLA
jgi:hypothetical protein